jgi:hypothetical protein
MSVSNIETIHNNSKIPDGINVGKAHPLKNFVFMMMPISGLALVVFVVLLTTAQRLVRYIPFEAEVIWARQMLKELIYLPAANT